MTPRYRAIMAYWEDDQRHLELEHKVWDPTPWVIDVRSPYPDGSPASFRVGDVDRRTHVRWLRDNIGTESWPIHNAPGDWYFGGATVCGETWLGFRTKDMMDRFIAFFPQSLIPTMEVA